MFQGLGKVGELNKMRQQAKALQDELSQIKESYEKNGYKIVVTGDQKISYLEIDGEEKKDLVDAINTAFKNVQKKSAKKMMEMGGGISGLLGGLGK